MEQKSHDNLAFVIDDQWKERSGRGYAANTSLSASSGSKKSKSIVNDKENEKPISFYQIFRFASRFDIFLIALSALAAISSGVCLPITLVLFGNIANAFVENSSSDMVTVSRCKNATANITDWQKEMLKGNISIPDEIRNYAIGTGSVGLVSVLLSFIYVTCLNIAAENQVYRLRSEFFKAVLKQEIAWHDAKSNNDFAARVTDDLNKIQEGIGEKMGMALSYFCIAIVSVIVAFLYGWELTLVMIATLPILSLSTGILAKIQTTLATKELQTYANAGGLAEEIISAIKTVVVFGGQQKEVKHFETSLIPARKAGIKRGLASGLGAAVGWGVTYASHALAFWYGVELILNSCTNNKGYDAGSLNIIFFNVLYAAYKGGMILPFVESFSIARGAAGSIFHIIDRVPQIDSSSPLGLKPTTTEGRIHFRDVHFSYPSRPDVPILKGIDFEVSPGQTVALVGLSGCGKSTCIQLIQRFYDPVSGRIELDGKPLPELNIQWLRDQIGIVGQEPVLFGTTIGANIRYGQDGLSQEDVERAARQANAHHFIQQLPLKYDTLVGERGAQLSGGQKQRIAIARALVGNPKILLFDEATSALDNQSEAIVQKALDKAREGRTTIIVAHRLTTIRNADMIFTFEQGIIKEIGSHKELMEKEGLYCKLVSSQQSGHNKSHDKDILDCKHGDSQSHESKSFVDDAVNEPLSMAPSLQKDHEKKVENVSLWKLFQYNKPEWKCIALGALGSLLIGVGITAYAVVYGEVMGVLGISDPEEVRRQSSFLSIMFLVVAVAMGVGAFMQTFMFTIAGEHLTYRLRVLTFESILSQEVAFFDRQENSVGSLCSRLSSDASSIQGATGARLGIFLQVIVSMLSAFLVSVFLNWKLGLVTSAFVPFVLSSGLLETKIESGQNVKKANAVEKSTNIAMETISNIRTVASLGRESTFHSLYMNCLLEPHLATKRRSPIRGLIFGITTNISSLTYMVTLVYGGYLVQTEGMDYKIMFTIGEALIFGMEMIGNMLAFTPNYGKAKIAAKRVFQLIERQPLMAADGYNSEKGSYMKEVTANGKVDFDNVHFSYPTRKDALILRGLSAAIRPGQTVALVGQSGCGKSTCIQLLERFYDPDSGTVSVDDHDISPTNVARLRSKLGIVSQEPVLFNRTIGENIAYGDQSRDVPMADILAAARKANIHHFVQGLPLGYDTMVGQRGAQLSGGQKQRVAIARALIRNPRILLLDEATSALDSESEKVVQEALDKAREGRTCITIAHRLSTIQNADHILVIHQGRVHEQGKHEQLLRLKKIYYQLWNIQTNTTI